VRTKKSLEPDIAASSHRTEGLDAGNATAKPYRELTRSLGVQPGVDLTKALRLAAELEDEETVRKLELRR